MLLNANINSSQRHRSRSMERTQGSREKGVVKFKKAKLIKAHSGMNGENQRMGLDGADDFEIYCTALYLQSTMKCCMFQIAEKAHLK